MSIPDSFVACCAEARFPPARIVRGEVGGVAWLQAEWNTPPPAWVVQKAAAMVGLTFSDPNNLYGVRLYDRPLDGEVHDWPIDRDF